MDDAKKFERLAKAAERGRLDINELIAQCRDGRSQFHDSPNACAITTIGASGKHRVCHVTVLGGTLAGWRELLPVIEQFARENKCQVVQGTCRPGTAAPWQEDSQGYRPIAMVYEKVL